MNQVSKTSLQKATEIYTYPDESLASRAVAERIQLAAAAAINARGRFLLVLSGGRSPRVLYRLLSTEPYCDAIDWPRVEFFWSDERMVPPDHEESNYRMACDLLLRPLRIAPEHVHRIRGECHSAAEAAADYEAQILHSFGGEAQGLFDVTLLGLGADGHTASLFPSTAALREVDKAVVVGGQLSKTRVTMTVPRLLRSREILFLVTGHNKASAVAAVFQGPEDLQQYPAQMIRPQHGAVEWFLDSAAGQSLKPAADPAG